MAVIATIGIIVAGYAGYAGWTWWVALAIGALVGITAFGLRSAPALAGSGAGAMIYSATLSLATFGGFFCGVYFLARWLAS